MFFTKYHILFFPMLLFLFFFPLFVNSLCLTAHSYTRTHPHPHTTPHTHSKFKSVFSFFHNVVDSWKWGGLGNPPPSSLKFMCALCQIPNGWVDLWQGKFELCRWIELCRLTQLWSTENKSTYKWTYDVSYSRVNFSLI